MDTFPIVVVGASEGGVNALPQFLAALPEKLPAAIFVVMHIGANKSQLAALINSKAKLRAANPKDGEKIRAGKIYVAPPDHHMIMADGIVNLTKGPRENFARPSIDPLFRSAAEAYGPAVIGIIMTGGLNDGTAGLFEIKRRGGIAIIQDPDDSANPSMPQSAATHVDVDHCVPLAALAPLLVRIVAELDTKPAKALKPAKQLEAADMEEAQFTLDKPMAQTCPDCGGALRPIKRGTLTQFRCHIGHAYTAETMVSGQLIAMERFIESAMRSLNERADLCRQMANEANLAGRARNNEVWMEAAREATEQTAPLRSLLERAWMHPEVSDTGTGAGSGPAL